jgi:hypothetical protein
MRNRSAFREANETVERCGLAIPSFKRPKGCLCPISHAQSSEKTLYVDLDGALTDVNLASNLLVRLAFEETFEDGRLSR